VDLNQAIAQSGLLEKAEARLKQKLALNPYDVKMLETLGHTYRRKGDLRAAAGIFGQLCDQDPQHPTAAYLHAVLSGMSLPTREPEIWPWPVPFVRIEHFLPQNQRDRLLDLACDNQNAFEPMKLYKPSETGHIMTYQDRDVRHQVGLIGNPEVDAIVKPRVVDILPGLLPRLQAPPFPIGDTTLQLVLSHDGHYGKAHADDLDSRIKVTFIYYFHKQPKAFSGGELLFYDTDLTNRTYNAARYTQINHEDNVLLIFPSPYAHAITPVRCNSEAFEDGRFAVSGFVGTAVQP
jgi:SM-20-related protein